jgi:hypothetical protein
VRQHVRILLEKKNENDKCCVILYADNAVLMFGNAEELQVMLKKLEQNGRSVGFKITLSKIKVW